MTISFDPINALLMIVLYVSTIKWMRRHASSLRSFEIGSSLAVKDIRRQLARILSKSDRTD